MRELHRARRASSTPTATATSRSASRAATAAAGSSTPAAARPAAASCARCRAAAAEHARIDVLEGDRVAGAPRATAASRSTTATPIQARADDPRHRRRRRAVVAHDQPARLVRLRPDARPRAGAQLADLEFTQFHPTAVVGLKGREGFLISEAVRGEGATLHDHARRALRRRARARATHVARAIFNLLQARSTPSAGHDDGRPRPLPEHRRRRCRRPGLDPTTQRVPVAPASHYVMGGIVTDLDGRATGVERLYAVGECACTGLHGANRLASNSLSECFVFGRRAALAGARRRAAHGRPDASTRDVEAPTRETREAVWLLAGLERNAEDLDAPAGATPTRSPASSPPARCTATRRAARTAAPSSRSTDPRPGRPPHDPRPAHRDARASRHGRTPDRLGRRPHDEHVRLLRRVQRAVRASDARAAVRGTCSAREPHLVDLESGAIDMPDVRAPRRPRARRRPGRPRQAPHGATSRPTSRCATRSSATTTPASRPRSCRTRGARTTTTST